MDKRRQPQQLMNLMREFGALQRKRLGEGVTPLEFQRWLDLKNRIGNRIAKAPADVEGAGGVGSEEGVRTRLLVEFQSRAELLDALIENINPAGIFVHTPFAALTGTEFTVHAMLEREGESADFPATVVTSIVQGAHTLSTTSMGMGLKIDRLQADQAAGVSKLFAQTLDAKLGIESEDGSSS